MACSGGGYLSGIKITNLRKQREVKPGMIQMKSLSAINSVVTATSSKSFVNIIIFSFIKCEKQT